MMGISSIGDAAIGSVYVFRAYYLPATTHVFSYTGVDVAVLGGAGGPIILNTTEGDFVSGIVVASTTNLPVTWQYGISPTSDNFTVTTTGHILTVNYVSDDGLWRPMVIYLDNNNNLKTVNGWDALPTPVISPEIISMSVDGDNTKLWTLSVTATDSLMNVYTNSYTLKVEANYSINRDLLTSKLAGRF